MIVDFFCAVILGILHLLIHCLTTMFASLRLQSKIIFWANYTAEQSGCLKDKE